MIDRILLPVFRTVIAVVLAVLFAVSIVVFGIDRYLLRDTVYDRIPQDDGFVSGMKGYILEVIEDECLFYDLPFEPVSEAVTDEWVASLCEEYADTMYTAMNSGEDVGIFEIDPTPYRETLDAFFASLPEEERPLDPNTAQTIAKELAIGTAHVLQGGVSDKLIDYGHRFIYGNVAVRRLRGMHGWLWLLTAVAAVCCLLPIHTSWKRRVYATAGSLFIGSSLVFVPLWLLHQHDIPSRWVLGESPLKLYADRIWNGVIGGMTNTALILFILCAVLLLASVVIRVLPEKE